MFKCIQRWLDRNWLKWHGVCPKHLVDYTALGNSNFRCLMCYHEEREIIRERRKVNSIKNRNEIQVRIARLKGEQ